MQQISKRQLTDLIEGLFAENEFEQLFSEKMDLNDKLQYLTSESMLALLLVTTLEDELEIEFADDEIDLSFFSEVEVIYQKVQNHLS